MKTLYRNILVLFLVAAIFFVGAGVSVVHYCCSVCIVDATASAGDHMAVSVLAEPTSTCCSDKGVSPVDVDNAVLCVTSHTDHCCETKRISIDLENSNFQLNLLSSLIWVAAPISLLNFSDPFSNHNSLASGDIKASYSIPPRDYLTLIRVLII